MLRPPEQKMRYPIARSLSSDKIGTKIVFGAENFGSEIFLLPSLGGAVSGGQELKIQTLKNKIS